MANVSVKLDQFEFYPNAAHGESILELRGQSRGVFSSEASYLMVTHDDVRLRLVTGRNITHLLCPLDAITVVTTGTQRAFWALWVGLVVVLLSGLVGYLVRVTPVLVVAGIGIVAGLYLLYRFFGMERLTLSVSTGGIGDQHGLVFREGTVSGVEVNATRLLHIIERLNVLVSESRTGARTASYAMREPVVEYRVGEIEQPIDLSEVYDEYDEVDEAEPLDEEISREDEPEPLEEEISREDEPEPMDDGLSVDYEYTEEDYYEDETMPDVHHADTTVDLNGEIREEIEAIQEEVANGGGGEVNHEIIEEVPVQSAPVVDPDIIVDPKTPTVVEGEAIREAVEAHIEVEPDNEQGDEAIDTGEYDMGVPRISAEALHSEEDSAVVDEPETTDASQVLTQVAPKVTGILQDIDPDQIHKDSLLQRAQNAYSARNYDETIEYLKQVILLEPEYVPAIKAMAKTCRKMGDEVMAIRCEKRVEQILARRS